MGLNARPLLERQRIFQSRNVEETRAFLETKEFRFDHLEYRDQRFDCRINGVYLPGAYLGYIQYGSRVAIRTTPARSDYWIQFPIRGHLEATIGRELFACDLRSAVVWSPTRESTLRSDAGSARLNLSLTPAALTQQLTALLDAPLRKPLEFAPAMCLTQGYGRSLARYIRMVAGEFEGTDSLLWAPMVLSQIEEFILTALLVAHPHNYTAALDRLSRPIASRDVKRAVDYMQANADTPITLSELVRVSKVPGRTLFKHFQDYKGTSPMGYLRTIRFERARETLRRAEPDAGVAGIAEGCGFGHMGRFAVEYRKRFGESPSETLRRRGNRLR